MSHEVPNADIAEIVDRALLAYIAQLEKKRFGVGARKYTKANSGQERQRSEQPSCAKRDPGQRSRHIPNEIKRQVYKRDEGRCTYVSPDGKRCEATSHLEYDHVRPFAKGGETTVQMMRLRCRTHNQLEADRAFGKAKMDYHRQGGEGRNIGSPGVPKTEEFTLSIFPGEVSERAPPRPTP
jgi:5-methylcytosine-specific restriction endonuclease McrA